MGDDLVTCDTHGEGLPAAFLCRHLADGTGVGWCDAGGDGLCPDAWCSACEARRHAAGGWKGDAETFADIKVLCAACYHRIRGAHLAVDLDLSSPEALVRAARAEMQRRNDARREGFTSGGQWWFDLDEARFELRFADRPAHRFRMIMLGSYNDAKSSWMAASVNRSVPAIAGAPSAAVTGFLQRRGFDALAQELVRCELADAWDRAAVAAAVLAADAVYRCPSGQMHLFFALFDGAALPGASTAG